DAELNVRASELEIGETANLSLTSSSSEIDIKDAFSVKIDSRNDKLEIENIQVIQGKGVFSQISLGRVESLIDLDLSYGDIQTGVVLSKFSKVDVEGRSTDINLVLSEKSSFKATLVAKEDNFNLDQSLKAFSKNDHGDKKGYAVITGNYGSGNASELTVEAQGGVTFKKFIYEEEAVELLLTGRNRGLQLTGMYQYHRPLEMNFSDRFYLHYGVGGHFGYEKRNDYRLIGPFNGPLPPLPPDPFDQNTEIGPRRQSQFTMGVDAIVGVEYRWLSVPITL
ncbi:Uncharacterized protein SCF082_LOCUS34117, partial [Durusdinium trenchii]